MSTIAAICGLCMVLYGFYNHLAAKPYLKSLTYNQNIGAQQMSIENNGQSAARNIHLYFDSNEAIFYEEDLNQAILDPGQRIVINIASVRNRNFITYHIEWSDGLFWRHSQTKTVQIF